MASGSRTCSALVPNCPAQHVGRPPAAAPRPARTVSQHRGPAVPNGTNTGAPWPPGPQAAEERSRSAPCRALGPMSGREATRAPLLGARGGRARVTLGQRPRQRRDPAERGGRQAPGHRNRGLAPPPPGWVGESSQRSPRREASCLGPGASQVPLQASPRRDRAVGAWSGAGHPRAAGTSPGDPPSPEASSPLPGSPDTAPSPQALGACPWPLPSNPRPPFRRIEASRTREPAATVAHPTAAHGTGSEEEKT